MNERLKIKNFSIFNEVDIEIKNFNVIIGDQATGKSLLSKIIFFFQQTVVDTFMISILGKTTFDKWIKSLENEFFKIFPPYFWENQNFEFNFYYRFKDTSINIKRDKNSNAPLLYIDVSKRIEERYKIISNEFYPKIALPNDQLIKEVNKTFNTHFTIFTPASRSFFSLVQENIFSLSLLGISGDIFINYFGSYYEKFKNIERYTHQDFQNNLKQVLKGEFFYDKKSKEIFIYDFNNKRIKLRDSSTGQQELVPILILLNAILYEQDLEHFLIIEEPGSHLFPQTQKKLIELFALVYNITGYKTGFLFTTHTPYILSSLNNLIEAKNIEKLATDLQRNDILEQLNEIIPQNVRLDFDDFTAFQIVNGGIKNIKDDEQKLINAEVIDDVSEQIAEEFSQLLELEQKLS